MEKTKLFTTYLSKEFWFKPEIQGGEMNYPMVMKLLDMKENASILNVNSSPFQNPLGMFSVFPGEAVFVEEILTGNASWCKSTEAVTYPATTTYRPSSIHSNTQEVKLHKSVLCTYMCRVCGGETMDKWKCSVKGNKEQRGQ